MHRRKPLVLMILDGWGYSDNPLYNAIASAKKPHWDTWWTNSPHCLLNASGVPVGLPAEQMGNSEVGHMHIGAGRVVPQDFTRINAAIDSGKFAATPLLIDTLRSTQATQKTVHVMGLLSPGGVHSHENHLFAFLALCHQYHFHHVCLHLFLDGRDTPPKSAKKSLNALQKQLTQYPVGHIHSLCGRYYAMDRDNRWERTAAVYELLATGHSEHHFDTPLQAIETFYAKGITDEFISPSIIGEAKPIQDGDSVFFFNFRADRARQLTKAFIEPHFTEFTRSKCPVLAHFISMTAYAKNLVTDCVFPPHILNNTLGEMISRHGLSQLRIAETEKYAHVTFFFNGGSEQVFDNEDRILIPSPLVPTYDCQPEMSAPALTHSLVKAIENDMYDVIICNYANADMVGHTGNFAATLQAIECLDQCMSQVWEAVRKKNGHLLITADHGNAEAMFDEKTKQAHTAHTNQPVPLLYLGEDWHFKQEEGSLVDIAPTLLNLLGITPPDEMTGSPLLVRNHVVS